MSARMKVTASQIRQDLNTISAAWTAGTWIQCEISHTRRSQVDPDDRYNNSLSSWKLRSGDRQPQILRSAAL
ncbi:MAG: hypothetical protein ACLUAR_16785 [Pilosibacter sp.]